MTAMLGFAAPVWFLLGYLAMAAVCFVALVVLSRWPEPMSFPEPKAEPETASDLDGWLGEEGVGFEFEVWKRPVSSTQGSPSCP